MLRRFPALAPLPVFPQAGGARRLTLVTDSIAAGSLFGGVGTAIALACLLARRLDVPLRVATRNEEPVPGNFGDVVTALGIPYDANVEFMLVNDSVAGRALPLSDTDLLLTTSWWTTRSALASVRPERIIYLLQEDERMFYPAGDEQLRCAETLDDPRPAVVVNTSMLRDHFIADGLRGAGEGSIAFEPAFPARIYFAQPRPGGTRRRFFFYARPNNARNLFLRGMEVISAAIIEGVLDPAEWEFHFAGKDIPAITLPGQVRPVIHQGLPWHDYAALVRSTDLGLCLMSTPHPSYPPLDLAASGAVVVTSRHGRKQDLSALSANIICADPSVAGLLDGLRAGVALAQDAPRRAANAASGTIARDWEAAFAPVLERLVAVAGR
ncbi:hypothetical protein [Roseomonas sp. CECT 9278]|uniref:rhamnosyltransferase WsaF family glycosyltransferase n=1 Tax=Roseomonas sp. CECT 9278 TaxID=2845823 RepID=UPI001E37131A|nr:hypothetical protein [Roseomonas sp. CECT 9278]CAH0194176.1 hypothetical protein ROS9278_01759 [Roseomonas sp. CECT 9278]